MTAGSGILASLTVPPARQGREVGAGELEGFGDVEIADQHQGRVVGHVEGVVKLLHIGERGAFEVLDRADGQVFIRVEPIRVGQYGFAHQAIGLVLIAHAALFPDHVAFLGEVLLADVERSHAVGLEPQHTFQVIGGEGLPIDGLVEGGVGVDLAAGLTNQAHVLLGGDVFRAAEHEVLEQVGEAGAAGLLVLRADVIPDLEIGDGARTVFGQDDVEAVGQGLAVDLESRRCVGGGLRAREDCAAQAGAGFTKYRTHDVSVSRVTSGRRDAGGAGCGGAATSSGEARRPVFD